MDSSRKASLVAAVSLGAVEALEDQAGPCRWNYALRTLHQRAKRSMAPSSQAAATRKSTSPPPPSSGIDQWRRGGETAAKRAQRTQEFLSKVMYWDRWGPK